MKRFLLSAALLLALVLVSGAGAQEPQTVTICNSESRSYTFEFTDVCPEDALLEWIGVAVKGPKRRDGAIGYRLDSIEPYGWFSGWADPREHSVYWDMRYMVYLVPFQVRYTVTVTDSASLPLTQTIPVTVSYICDYADGETIVIPVTWTCQDCNVYLPLITKASE